LSAARSQILLAARAAKIQAFDSVFSDVRDKEGFIEEVKKIKNLGFDGKSLVNPNQIYLLHHIYAPSQEEIEWALEVVEAAEYGKRNGLGVISIDGRMVDAPVIARAEFTLNLARISGLIGEDDE